MTIALILDGDMLAYAACAGAQHEVEDPPFWWTWACDHKQARKSFKHNLDQIAGNLDGTPTLWLCLTDEANFRKAIWPTYKGGRGRKPPGYGAFRDWLLADKQPWRAFKRDGLEGDDVMGILATAAEGPIPQDQQKIIWSGDKDLRQIPGLHVNRMGKVVEVDPCEAHWKHVEQTLTGDVTDNYPGCPGMGPAKFRKLRDRHEAEVGGWPAIWAEVEKSFLAADRTREDFLVQARVARILTADLYDFVERRPILWEPPT